MRGRCLPVEVVPESASRGAQLPIGDAASQARHRRRLARLKRIPGLALPKEHGAWAMLYVPFVLGVVVAGHVVWPTLWALLAMTALFFGREGLRRLRRARQQKRSARSQSDAPLGHCLSRGALVVVGLSRDLGRQLSVASVRLRA
ncbi:MAG TPA: YwiC-like family protein, partial [Candidatus Krumholzibacteria bacterium]|nr:YwiC-like family protein [Candidatus Krumholzibacteria bacterium]